MCQMTTYTHMRGRVTPILLPLCYFPCRLPAFAKDFAMTILSALFKLRGLPEFVSKEILVLLAFHHLLT